MKKSEKLARALAEKGWQADVYWEPIRNGGIMCGAEGGWCIDIKNYDIAQLKGIHGFWLGYNYPEAVEAVAKYPTYVPE